MGRPVRKLCKKDTGVYLPEGLVLMSIEFRSLGVIFESNAAVDLVR